MREVEERAPEVGLGWAGPTARPGETGRRYLDRLDREERRRRAARRSDFDALGRGEQWLALRARGMRV